MAEERSAAWRTRNKRCVPVISTSSTSSIPILPSRRWQRRMGPTDSWRRPRPFPPGRRRQQRLTPTSLRSAPSSTTLRTTALGAPMPTTGLITNDVNAVITDMQGLMHANPTLFSGLTGIHADTIVRQLELEKIYIKEAGVNPDAGRASNDNILDIIDIVQGDTNLANMANQGGVSGFSPFPDALNPTPKYMDNADQTNFWANFIAQSNSLGQQANQVVGSHDAAAI